MRKALLVGFLGGALLLACGDAGQNTSGYYRGPTGGDPGTPSEPAPTNPGTPANPNNPGTPGTPATPGAPAPPAAGAAKLDITLDNAAPPVELGAEVKVMVNIAPKEGLTGKVDLSVTGMPAGVTATFDKTSVDIVGTASSSAILTIKTSTDTVPATAGLTITAKPASGDMKTSPVNVNVQPTLTLKIPVNAGALTGMAANTAFAPADVKVKLGGKKIAVKVRNDDSATHIIHSGNTGGFNHGNTGATIAANGGFEGNVQGTNAPREINAAGTYGFYLHDRTPTNANGRIIAE